MRAVVFFISFLLCFIQGTVNAGLRGCEQQKCVVVVDVGSTGSRLHVYSYDLDNDKSPIKITERWSKKIKPGFATIEANKSAINAYLTNLFAGAPAYHTPVYFFATAGMRLLPKPKQQQYHALVREWFNSKSNWQLMDSKTITGSEEGVFGWLAVNYQLGTLNENSESIGVVDMGGASVQIAFPVKNTSDIDGKDIQELDIYGQHVTLFVHSFLGLGQNEVAHQFLDSPSCFISSYEMPTGELAQGDAYSCKSEVSSLMNAVHQVSSVVQPGMATNPVSNWYVLGGLVDLVQSQPFDFNSQEFTNQDLLEKAHSQVCQQQWSTLNARYPNNDYLYGYCLFPAYYYALMVDGYGIQPQQNLKYLEAHQSSDWTIGVVLHQDA